MSDVKAECNELPDRVVPVRCRWSKQRRGGWLVRGPAGLAGLRVEVTNMTGGSRIVRLGHCVWEGKYSSALYAVAVNVLRQKPRPRSARTPAPTGV